jgi:type II secretion system protein D
MSTKSSWSSHRGLLLAGWAVLAIFAAANRLGAEEESPAKPREKASAAKTGTKAAKKSPAASSSKPIALAQNTDDATDVGPADSAPAGEAGPSEEPGPIPTTRNGKVDKSTVGPRNPALRADAAAAVPAPEPPGNAAAGPAAPGTANPEGAIAPKVAPKAAPKVAPRVAAPPPAPGTGAPAGPARGPAPAGPARPAAGNPGAAGANAAAGAPGQAAAPGAAPPTMVQINPSDQITPGQKVNITEGKIPLLDFLRFLSNYTGLPLLHNSNDPNIASKEIQIAGDIKEADEDLVKSILEINGFRVIRETLPSGKEVLKVESMVAAQPTTEDPKEVQVIEFDERNRMKPPKKEDVFPKEGPSSDEFATMVFTLKYTAPTDAAQALNNLIIKSGAAGGGAPGAAGVPRGSKSFSMVDVKNTMMLIITAKFGLLNYIKRLLELIDVPVKEPERIIEVIEVQESDPQDLVSIIQDFLQGGGTGRGGGMGRSRSRSRTGVPGQPGQPGQPPVPGQVPGGAGNQQDYYQTNLLADPRTNKIIVETYSEQDLQDIMMLVRELDIRYDGRRLRTHIYQVRYLKAVEVAGDIQSLLGGAGSGSMSGLRRGATGTTGARTTSRTSTAATRRTSASTRTNLPGGQTGTPGQQGGGGQNAPLPSLIVPHEPTNSLLIQAEPEDFDEIMNILSQIDTKRRQVFLEAALVQVQSASNLNFTIELLAGNPDDQATRALFASSFGLTGIDFENFNRVVPNISDPASVPQGGLLAIMSRGKLPAIIRFFKTNRDSQILATPFVLADDNMENLIDISETRFITTTNTVNTATTTSQQGEEAGIKLTITPTISGSEKAVFLQMDLELSEFAEATTGGGATLPPKNSNIMTSSVTIPDGQVFVVGGLTRQSKSKAVSKLPILGDIPIIGKLFRSESTAQSQNNLYIFLQAHILVDEEFKDGVDLTEQAQKKIRVFDPSIQEVQFGKPNVERKPRDAGPDADRIRNLNQDSEAPTRGNSRTSTGPGRESVPGTPEAGYDGAKPASGAGEAPAGTAGPPASRTGSAPPAEKPPARTGKRPPAKGATGKTAVGSRGEDHDGWLRTPPESADDGSPGGQEE